MEARTPPFRLLGPAEPASPVILSVPHAGRDYAPALLAAARVPLERLEALEDRLVDRLVWRAAAAGHSIIVATAPRAEIDLNRDEREIDPAVIAPPLPSGAALQSPRSRGGLGLVPSRLPGVGPIWHGRIPRAELVRRLEQIHRPYHGALAGLLEAARRRFGAAALLDCHSMPPRSDAAAPALVLGDLHGITCAPALVAAAAEAAAACGFASARNTPFAGGHIVARHGRPGRRIHALQLEIDRACYLGPDLSAPGPGFDAVARMIERVAGALADALAEEAEAAIAAE
jgi:N-formylglutamate amidohydrolase